MWLPFLSGFMSIDHTFWKTYDADYMKKALMQFAENAGPDQPMYRCSQIWAFSCSSTYITVSTDSVSGQRRPRSACAYAQTDLGLCCPQIA